MPEYLKWLIWILIFLDLILLIFLLVSRKQKQTRKYIQGLQRRIRELEGTIEQLIRADGSNLKVLQGQIQHYKEQLRLAKQKLETGKIDEIPQEARPRIPEFDADKDSFVMVSYSRKDFDKVYLFLAYMNSLGYRFWYDDGMMGSKKWLQEYKEKYDHKNCLGTLTFFSENYVSNSTKEEMEIGYGKNGTAKPNLMISLMPLAAISSEKVLAQAISAGRITIQNAAAIEPILGDMICREKEKTIHRYAQESDIRPLLEKIGKVFAIHNKK